MQYDERIESYYGTNHGRYEDGFGYRRDELHMTMNTAMKKDSTKTKRT
jgi:hypothetical protein